MGIKETKKKIIEALEEGFICIECGYRFEGNEMPYKRVCSKECLKKYLKKNGLIKF